MRGLIRPVLVVVLLLVSPVAQADNLTGKTLSPSTDVQTGLQSALGSLISGTVKGEVTQVVVSSDQDRRLAVTVSYAGFEGARMWAEVAGGDKKTQKLIRCTPKTVTAAPGDLEFALELDPNAPENTTVKSVYLRVCVSPAGKTSASYVKAFQLPKMWKVGADPEKMLLTITPRPVGTTATLGASPTYQLPPKVIHPTLIRATAMPPAASGGTRSVSPQIAMVRPVTGVSRQPATAAPAPSSAPAPATPRVITARPMITNQAVLMRTETASKTLPKISAMAAIGRYKFGLPDEAKREGVKGPAAVAVEPLGQVRSEDIDLEPSHILGVFPGFYPDQDAASGVYYFLPYAYSLRWDEDQGYDLRMIYSATTSEGQAGEVAMAARLDAGIGLRERQIASELMAAYAKANGLKFTALRAMPIDSISISISDDLRRYNIPADKIAITGLSDFLGQIDVSWLTDPVTKENLQQALVEDIGISGKVTLYPTGNGLGPVDVPIQIRLADFVTFGPFRWTRTDRWRNITPYPIKLKYVNALLLDPASRPVVYTWSLGGASVPPRAQVQWDAAQIPSWIDGQAKRLWIEYAVDDTCTTCDEQVIRSITGGVSTSGPSHIVFHTITPLADAGAYEIATQVRSKYFDPHSREPQIRTVVLNADGKDFPLGPVYVADRQAGDGSDPLFEYFLELTMKDGTTYKATRWIACDDLRLAVGRHQLEEALGSLPASH